MWRQWYLVKKWKSYVITVVWGRREGKKVQWRDTSRMFCLFKYSVKDRKQYEIHALDNNHLLLVVGTTHTLWLCLHLCMCVSLSIGNTPDRSCLRLETSGVARQCDGWREGDKGGHRGFYGHQANCIQVEDYQEPASPDGQDEITQKIGNGGLDAVPSSRAQHAQMLPCTCTHSDNIHQIQTNWRNHHRRRQVCKMQPTC